jgi:hypothetical protein
VSFLSTFKASRQEENRRTGLRILRLYMDEFYKQLLAPLSDYQEREAILRGTTFMTEVTAELLVHLSDYFDTVREEAQLLLVCMIQRFLPPQLALRQEQLDLAQVLRATMHQGWANQLNGQLKEAARLEADMLKYLFTDAVTFVAGVIGIFIDESTGRENLMNFFKLLNVAAPFLLMNDFRIAK